MRMHSTARWRLGIPITCLAAKLVGSRHRAIAFFLQVPKLCTDLDPTFIYIWISGIYSQFAWKNEILALGVCFQQPCSSAGRMFTASKSRLNHYQLVELVRFHKNELDDPKMFCRLNSIPG